MNVFGKLEALLLKMSAQLCHISWNHMHVYRMWRKGSINEKMEKEKCKRRISYVLWCYDDGEKRRIV